ncbi:hypothetical protein [Methanobrevibacter sp.]|uniref:hypothetical protein n=1 Tax=Methanobrevibacter sp. TaxID=66852 RepID=UPI00388D53C0
MKSLKFRYIYDFAFDLVDFACEREFKFKRSVKMAEGVFLDFDERNMPFALELIGASKILGVHRKHLNNPNFTVHVEITRNLIKTEINLKYSINQRKFDISVENEIPNDYLMSSIEIIITN